MSTFNNLIYKYNKALHPLKKMLKLDNNTYYGGNLGGVTVTKKRKRQPYRWVSPRGVGNMTVMPGDPEMVFFAPIAAGAAVAASPALLSAGSAAMNGINAAGDALAATAAGQRLTSGLNFAANAIRSNKAWPWIDAGLTSIFGAQGADKIRRGDIHNVGDVVETGLDLMPLVQLAKPMYQVGKTAASSAGRVFDGLKDSYNAFKTNLNMPYRVSTDTYFHGSSNRGIEQLLPNSGRGNAIFFTNDNHAARGYTGVLGTGKVYEAKLDLGPKHFILDNNGDHIATITDETISKTFGIPKEEIKKYITPHHTFKAAFGRPEIAFYEGDDVIRLGNDLGASAVTIKNARDSGKGIFGAFRERPYDQTVVYSPEQVEMLPARVAETVTPRGLLSKEPLIAGGVPEITTENAASITSAQWTAAQDAAIARGDMAEAQRLRDLHFKVSAPNTVTTEVFHHGNKKPMDWYTFDPARVGFTDEGYSGAGYYFAPTRPASQYAKEHFSYTLGPHGEQNAGLSGGKYHRYVYLNGETKYKPLREHDWTTHTDFPFVDNRPIEVVVGDNRQIKLADAVTYDNNGVRIPLGERDNFKLNDIRYNWIAPFIGLGTLGISSRKQGGRLIRKFQNAGYIDYPANLFLHNYGATILPKIDLLADKAEVYADGISTLGSGIGTVGAVTGNPILSGIGVISQIPNGIIDLYLFLRGINKGDVEQSAFNGIEFGLDLLGGKIFSKTFKPTFKPTVGSLFRSNHHSPRVRKLMDYYGKQEELELRKKIIKDLKKRGVRKSQGLYFDTKFKERFTKEMERKALNINNFFDPFNKGITGATNTLANFGMLNMHLNRNNNENN